MKIKKWFYAVVMLALSMSFNACTNEEFDDKAGDSCELKIQDIQSVVTAVSATQNELQLTMNILQGEDTKIEKYGFCYTQDPECTPDIYNATTVIGTYTGFNEFYKEKTVTTTLTDVKAEETYYVRGYVILAASHLPLYTKVYKVEVGTPVYVDPAEETDAAE